MNTLTARSAIGDIAASTTLGETDRFRGMLGGGQTIAALFNSQFAGARIMIFGV